MKDASLQDRYRTFVVSTYESNVTVSTEMRTYDIHAAGSSPFIPASAYTVWEAARATAAAPPFFPPVNMDYTQYVSLSRDNPTAIAVEETKRIWGQSSEIAWRARTCVWPVTRWLQLTLRLGGGESIRLDCGVGWPSKGGLRGYAMMDALSARRMSWSDLLHCQTKLNEREKRRENNDNRKMLTFANININLQPIIQQPCLISSLYNQSNITNIAATPNRIPSSHRAVIFVASLSL
ncbi:hypothetical protein BT69DRAFT_654272 [Atractiella rhizophila]|nr:hypothetical protein BT69DRAFT_654272 [Atractiella rhizophila]